MNESSAGGCQCGAVRYEIEGQPVRSGLCFCTDCQRSTGSGHACYLVLEQAQLKVTGETSTFTGLNNKGDLVKRHFCPGCGNRLFAAFGSDRPRLSLYAGTLDDPGQFKPTVAIFTRQRMSWDPLPEGLECFTEEYQGP